ncbi:Double-stranded RNA-binding protein Staufen-like 2 [Papilio machaon]|uniref:Double-stranded RNA-binding protein Staufen-like 2 n=1 Tax=Papilio machaon TaxID=76193 RepID=A0A194QVP3_PAPMA|nr:Double-stranded RNA-binding protein Staufen-like 2 [Papilio machaon]
MMHHPNMHHQPMSGHPPQHLAGHQAMPAHHQMPPHQMHRENRHVTLTRMAMGPTGAHGQSLGGMGALGVHHAPPRAQHAQHAQHTIRAMTHHPPAQHHPIQPMKQMRRPYAVNSGSAHQYGPSGVLPQFAGLQPHQQSPAQPAHTPHTGLCRPSSPLMGQSKLSNFGQYDSNTIKVASASKNPAAHVGSTGREGEEGTAKAPEAEAGDVPAPAPAPLAPASASAGPAPATVAGPASASANAAASAAPPAAQANSKEKTPMCLVNELARYNKIKHQYRLTSETGPAHKKVFTVTLRLGETEEYTAEGSSIKRAQHAAASAALAGTTFPPPPPRIPPPHAPHTALHRHAGAVMPTVELNALAMKLCQPAVYTTLQPLAGAPRARVRPPPYRLPHAYRVRVCVGGRAWLGEGATPQAARHDAAARALHDLRPHPPPDPDADNGTHPHADDGDSGSDILNSEVKSPVSLVHELALKRNLSVQFSVKSEHGPPHMRVFVTVCTVGDMETEGEGNGKKVSKRRAAELMLEEMRRRWPPAALRARPAQDRRRPQPAKKRPRNLIKENRFGCPNGNGVGVGNGASGSAGVVAADNPISRLALARHAARARSPQYRVVEERGAARRREFLVQCDAPPHRATGLGPNKKTAKRRAAQNVLLAMEMANGGDTVAPAGDNVKANSAVDTKPNIDIKRKENESVASSVGSGGEVRQPVPGVLMMDYHQRSAQPHHKANGMSEPSGTGTGTGASGAGGAMDQLMYLSQLLGFTVEFSDFPKRNHGEYLSLVSLSTEPPVMCHGGGASTAASHEQCARAALRSLRLLGLEPAAPTATTAPTSHHQTNDTSRMQSMAAAGPKAGVINGLSE